MEEPSDRLLRPEAALRTALVIFVLAWILGPYALRSAVPIWIPFLIALGLELNFLVAALRPARARSPDRAPQPVDHERYGYDRRAGEPENELDEVLDDEDELYDRAVLEGEAVADRRRLSVRRFLVGIGVISALALIVWFVESRTGWDALSGDTRAEAVARFSEEASRIAEKPVTIRCDESRDYVGLIQHADGVAAVGGDRAYLTPERCLDLYRLAFKGEVTSSQTARALAVLAHEAWHLRGVADEGTTECYALQSGVDLGRHLGLSEDTARQMMRQQLVENALRGAGSSEYVVSAECRDGGRLDLGPGDSRFP